jgi:hypothetical protein
MKKSMKTLETVLLERILKRHMEIQGNNENNENNCVEIRSHMGSILSHLQSTNTESQIHDHSLLQDTHHQGFVLAPRNRFIPNIDMRKFDSKDPITWIFHMEQFFDLHQTPRLHKVPIASLYLENNQFVWYQWLCEIINNSIIYCFIFIDELISHYGDIKINTLFGQLINIR